MALSRQGKRDLELIGLLVILLGLLLFVGCGAIDELGRQIPLPSPTPSPLPSAGPTAGPSPVATPTPSPSPSPTPRPRPSAFPPSPSPIPAPTPAPTSAPAVVTRSQVVPRTGTLPLHPGGVYRLECLAWDRAGNPVKMPPKVFQVQAQLGGPIKAEHFKVTGSGMHRKLEVRADCPTATIVVRGKEYPARFTAYCVVDTFEKGTSPNLRLPVAPR